MLSLSLRQVEYALAVGRHGGMGAAAQALHVSQPALSVALAQLEAHLGQPLFLRRPGGRLVPSPFGTRWLAEAGPALAAMARLADSAAPRAAPLRLAVFEDLAATCLAPLIAAATGAGLALDPLVAGFDDLTQALRQGRADMALTWDLGLDHDTHRQVLALVPPHAVLAADHPLAARESLTLADLADQPLVLADQGLSLAHMRGLFARAGLGTRIAHRTPTLELMRSYAAHGLGVGLSYTNPAARLSQDGRPLVTRPLTNAGAEPLVLARPAAAPPTPAMQALAALAGPALPAAAFPDRIAQPGA